MRRLVHIVDDDSEVRAATSFMLRQHGYETQIYASGAELLGMADKIGSVDISARGEREQDTEDRRHQSRAGEEHRQPFDARGRRVDRVEIVPAPRTTRQCRGGSTAANGANGCAEPCAT